MKVLITGSSGFLGRNLVQYLQQNTDHELIMPSSKELNLVHPSVGSGVKGGPLQYGAIKNSEYGELVWTCDNVDAIYFYLSQSKIDAVVHLAATCGGIGINKDNPGKFMYENLEMGINIVEACRRANIKKLINLSTVCSYPKNAPVPFRESDIWNGFPEETNAPYGIAKKTIVELGIAYNKQYGLNVTNLVPVNMAGEFDHFDLYSSHVLPALVRKFEEAKDVVLLWGTGSASREFLDAKDCARAISIALEKDTGPEPINLGTGKEISIKELAETVKRVGGYTAQIYWDRSKPDGQPRRCLDVTRAKNVLNWEATTSLEDLIAKTIKWYRNESK